ncbi:MAG: flagellar hook-basal body complex protein FliE [Nitrososphaerota archaeon]|nr:flagellar hook-basal body complex protein FliE [Nitrososphaerota archaeon]
MVSAKLVIGLGGMPGSGKSLVVETAREMGYDIVAMGDVVREQARIRGLEPTPQNIGAVMLALRAESGNYVIAQKCVPKIENQSSGCVLIDGLRSISEVDIFRAHFALFTLISVHAPPQTRFERLKRRGRSDDPTTYEGFVERDNRELGVGVGNVVAMSEQIVVNDRSIEDFKALMRENFSRIETLWLKK